MSTVEVRAVSEREQQAVIDVITLAFSTDPMARWAYPNPQTYLAVMPETIKAFGGNGFAHGTVHLVDGGGAAAMWLPPGVQPDSERLEVLIEQHAPPERQADMTQVFEQMGRFHPEEPCWYLPLIGVDPTSPGAGLWVCPAPLRARARRSDRSRRISRIVEPAQRAAVRAARIRGPRKHPGRLVADSRPDAAPSAVRAHCVC